MAPFASTEVDAYASSVERRRKVEAACHPSWSFGSPMCTADLLAGCVGADAFTGIHKFLTPGTCKTWFDTAMGMQQQVPGGPAAPLHVLATAAAISEEVGRYCALEGANSPECTAFAWGGLTNRVVSANLAGGNPFRAWRGTVPSTRDDAVTMPTLSGATLVNMFYSEADGRMAWNGWDKPMVAQVASAVRGVTPARRGIPPSWDISLGLQPGAVSAYDLKLTVDEAAEALGAGFVLAAQPPDSGRANALLLMQWPELTVDLINTSPFPVRVRYNGAENKSLNPNPDIQVGLRSGGRDGQGWLAVTPGGGAAGGTHCGGALRYGDVLTLGGRTTVPFTVQFSSADAMWDAIAAHARMPFPANASPPLVCSGLRGNTGPAACDGTVPGTFEGYAAMANSNRECIAGSTNGSFANGNAAPSGWLASHENTSNGGLWDPVNMPMNARLSFLDADDAGTEFTSVSVLGTVNSVLDVTNVGFVRGYSSGVGDGKLLHVVKVIRGGATLQWGRDNRPEEIIAQPKL